MTISPSLQGPLVPAYITCTTIEDNSIPLQDNEQLVKVNTLTNSTAADLISQNICAFILPRLIVSSDSHLKDKNKNRTYTHLYVQTGSGPETILVSLRALSQIVPITDSDFISFEDRDNETHVPPGYTLAYELYKKIDFYRTVITRATDALTPLGRNNAPETIEEVLADIRSRSASILRRSPASVSPPLSFDDIENDSYISYSSSPASDNSTPRSKQLQARTMPSSSTASRNNSRPTTPASPMNLRQKIQVGQGSEKTISVTAFDRITGDLYTTSDAHPLAGKTRDARDPEREHTLLQKVPNKRGIIPSIKLECHDKPVSIYYNLGDLEKVLDLVFALPDLDSASPKNKPTEADLDKKISMKDLITIALDIGYGLTALKQAGIIHRDIKPQNIFVERRDGTVAAALGDFGFACLEKNDGDKERPAGTVMFQAPELTANYATLVEIKSDDERSSILAEITTASDIWSMGLSLLYMLSFQTMIDLIENTNRQLDEKLLENFTETEEDVPHFLDSLYKGLKERNNRTAEHKTQFSDDEEILDAFERALETEDFGLLSEPIRACLKVDPNERISPDDLIHLLSGILDDPNNF